MKQQLLLVFAFLYGAVTNAQETTLQSHAAQAILIEGRLEIHLTANFTIGGGVSCPPMVWTSLESSSDTLRIDAIYNTYGTWQMFGCTSVDTIVFDPYTMNACALEVRFFDHQAIGALSSDTVQAGDPESTMLCIVSIRTDAAQVPKIFPNPFNDRINLAELPGGTATIELFDASGRQVFQKVGTANELRVVMFPQLSDGLYQILIRTEEGIISQKLVKGSGR